MSRDLNQCTFIGRLGSDVEMRYSPSGTAFASVSIACGDDYTKKDTGEKVEQTEWIPLSFTGRTAEIAGQYLKKGSLIYVSGKFKTRKWNDSNGDVKYRTEIVVNNMQMLGGDNNNQRSQPDNNQPNNKPNNQKQPVEQQPSFNQDDFDDDIPF